jgi:hypothetical protein
MNGRDDHECAPASTANLPPNCQSDADVTEISEGAEPRSGARDGAATAPVQGGPTGLVTPVGIVHPARSVASGDGPAPRLQLVPGNGHRVSFRGLRGALDRMRILYALPINGRIWTALRAMANDGAGTGLDWGDDRVECEVHYSGAQVVVQCEYFRLEVRGPLALVEPGEGGRTEANPDAPRSDRSRRYSAEVEVRGLACAHSTNGLAAVERARAACEALLWPGVPRAELAPATFPGRFDICFDVGVYGPDASEWIESQLFARGAIDLARAQWASRCRTKRIDIAGEDCEELAPDHDGTDDELSAAIERARGLGGHAKGRTMYLGGGKQRTAPMELCVYEKDKLTNMGWTVLSDTLRGMGWDGAARVMRNEYRATRDWLRDQVVDGVRCDRLTLDAFLALLPTIARALWTRYRHTEGSATRTRRRATSEYWQAAYTCAKHLDGPGELRVSALRSLKRARTFARARDAMEGIFALYLAAGGDGGRPLEWEAAHDAVVNTFYAVTADPARGKGIERKRMRFTIRIGAVPDASASAVA